MNPIVWTYTIYILIAVPVTIWVARTLHHNGKVFLVDCFNGNKDLAESVNHLLVVGFYLVNIGFIALYLKIGNAIDNAQGVFEGVAAKIGIVLLVLGGMHFFNLYLFTKMRKRALLHTSPPPVQPTAHAEKLGS